MRTAASVCQAAAEDGSPSGGRPRTDPRPGRAGPDLEGADMAARSVLVATAEPDATAELDATAEDDPLDLEAARAYLAAAAFALLPLAGWG